MGRTMTLRGMLVCPDGNRGAEKQLLDYVSPDRTRGWRIKDAWFWLGTVRASTPNDVNGMLYAQLFLSTEAVKPVFDSVVEDNRIFAWAGQQYLKKTTTSGSSTDFMLPNGGQSTSNKFVFDDDTTIVKELWIGIGTSQEGTDEPEREYNYLINLEEVKVTPSESIMQQLKGQGQQIHGL